MGAILSESDQHYMYIGIATITQNAANDHQEIILDAGEGPTNNGSGSVTTPMLPETVLNAFGKGRHGVGVWDVKKWQVIFNAIVVMEAGQVNSQHWGVHSLEGNQSAIPAGSNKNGGPVPARGVLARSITGAAGEVTSMLELHDHQDNPAENFDGTSFNQLLTKGNYRFWIDGAGNPNVVTAELGAWMRRVIVPLTEVFFDRDTIEGLLDAIVLSSILG